MVDLLIHNGLVRTMDPARPVASSVACEAGRILSLDESPSARRTIDLKGGVVVPGFIDAHAHMTAFGEMLVRLDLSEASSFADICRRVADAAKAGEWVVGLGWELGEFPSHADLSEVTSACPVWLWRKDLHSGLANAAAMKLSGISRNTPDPPGGRIGRDAAGEPTGMLFEAATTLVERHLPKESARDFFLAAQKEALRLGVTGVHDAWVDEQCLRLLSAMDQERQLHLDVHAMISADPVPFMESRPPVRGRVNACALKILVDGSLGSHTCWMLEPFRDDPGSCGVGRLTRDEIAQIGRVAASRGYQLCTHAIGDRAIRETLDAYESANPQGDHRWRIEHAQHIHPEDLSRFSRWIASIQPAHAVADRPLVDRYLGDSRRLHSFEWKRLPLRALGSDAPVESIDPRRTFHSAVTREGWGTGDPLTPEEALRGMTRDAAHAGFQEGGVIAPGRPADMAVLSCDWLKASPKEVLESPVLATIKEGRVACSSIS